ncbi:MAG: diaminopimelate decarboxylase [Oscillospiraceae bacterium]|nr:diaminopimelate decarboxylase [Oscillospiraceae bacterium]
MLYNNLSINDSGVLTFAGQDTAALASQFGTPLMLMDLDLVRSRCREYLSAMKDFLPAGSMPFYASKALSYKGIYKLMKEENMGVDVVSAGELYTALQAGFPAENICFHGSSKTDRDIRFAMENNVGVFVCDSTQELEAIEAEAARQGKRQKVLLRLQPGIDPHTHEKISTGKIDCKFGVAIETGQAETFVGLALQLPHLELMGYHCHIGSQIFDPEPFRDAAVMMLKFCAEMQEKYSYYPAVLDLGGGMGVPYVDGHPTISYRDNIHAIGKLIEETCREQALEMPAIWMEPGRSIVADAGITLYTAVSTKTIPGFRNYVAVDGGMGDNPRFALYQAEYTVLPADRMNDIRDFTCTVAGCCCESGDLIQENVMLPEPKRGDLLAVLTTGAYNYSMASNYNRVPRPPIVTVEDGKVSVAVRRETWEDIVRCDV